MRVEHRATLDDALARSEEYAPEHLELLVADPEALAARSETQARSSSAARSPWLGDYAAGATHVLPTGGLARSPAASASRRS